MKRSALSTPSAPRGADPLGEPLRGVAEPAADVEHTIPRSRWVAADGLLTVIAEPSMIRFPELDEAVE